MAVQGALWSSKCYSSTLFSVILTGFCYFSIKQLPIVLMRLSGPRSRPYTSIKISRVQPRTEPGTSWMAVRRANHYTKQVINALFRITNSTRRILFLSSSILLLLASHISAVIIIKLYYYYCQISLRCSSLTNNDLRNTKNTLR